MKSTGCIGVVLVFFLLTGCANPTDTEKPAMRALGQQATARDAISDEAIGVEARRRLELANPSASGGVIIEVSEGVVTLRGHVPTVAEAWRAEGVVRAVPGVREVRNEILVLP